MPGGAPGPIRRPTFGGPPPRPPSTEERLTRLEVNQEHVAEDLDQLLTKVSGLGEKFDALNENVIVLTEQRNAATKSRDRWMKVVVSVASGLALALITFLATIAWNVQHARLPPP